MNSIAARLLLGASLVLAAFVTLTYVAVKHSVHQRAEEALNTKMQGLVYGLLGASELVDDKQLTVIEAELPEQRLLSPVTGIYAEVRDSGNNIVWSSRSSVATIPAVQDVPVGTWQNVHRDKGTSEEVRAVQFKAIYVSENGSEPVFTFQVAEDATEFSASLASFDRNLWITLLLAALALLAVQLLVLAWGLRPLRRMGRDLQQIENGDKDSLETRLPEELAPMAHSINTLLNSERNRHLRYRNVMEDLAHSLKTPLSILRNHSSPNSQPDNRTTQLEPPDVSQTAVVAQQTERMNDIIGYHLQRAQAGGSQALAPPVSPLPTLERLADSLRKVYAPQDNKAPIQFNFDIHKDFQVRVNEADLMEILGNLLDNACKYGASSITVRSKPVRGMRQVIVEDNGGGFPETNPEILLERGRRADLSREGQGVGLALTRELVESYGGTLAIANTYSGGAQVTIGLR